MNHYLLLLLSFNLGIGLVLRLDSVLLIKGVEAVLLIFSTFISLLELVVELLLLEMVLLLYSFCFFISSNSMTIHKSFGHLQHSTHNMQLGNNNSYCNTVFWRSTICNVPKSHEAGLTNYRCYPH